MCACLAIQSELSGSGYETDSESEGANIAQLEQTITKIEGTGTMELEQTITESERTDPGLLEEIITENTETEHSGPVTIVIGEIYDHKERTVPSLVSLCDKLLKEDSHQNQVPSEDRLRLESGLSNFESDHFVSTSSHVSEDDEWVSVKSKGTLYEDRDSCEGESPTFTLAVISRRSRHRAGEPIY